jgi:hypothetical protein
VTLPERVDIATGTLITAAIVAGVSAIYLPGPLMTLIREAARVVWGGA